MHVLRRALDDLKRVEAERAGGDAAIARPPSPDREVEVEPRRIEPEKKKADAERRRIEAERRKAEAERKRIEAAKKKAQAERRRVEAEKRKVEAERKRIDAEKRKAEAERLRLERARRPDAERPDGERFVSLGAARAEYIAQIKDKIERTGCALPAQRQPQLRGARVASARR